MNSRNVADVFPTSLLLLAVTFIGCSKPDADPPPAGVQGGTSADLGTAETGKPLGTVPANPEPSTPDSPMNVSSLPVTPATPAEEITLDRLKDPAAAESHVNQGVRVTGKVAIAGHVDFLGDFIQVHLNATGRAQDILDPQPYVRAIFAKDHESIPTIRTLSIGQELTVEGELRRGQGAEHEWEIYSAIIVHKGDDPAVPITATELTQAFVDDVEAAKSKYGEATLRITGVVAATPIRFGQYAAITLEGSKNGDGEMTTIIAQYQPDFFFKYGSEPLTGDALAKLLPFQSGQEVSILARLQDPDSFGTGPDDRPGLAVIAWPASWPLVAVEEK